MKAEKRSYFVNGGGLINGTVDAFDYSLRGYFFSS
jgi:hypothetical protein